MKKTAARRCVVISDLHAHPWAAFATGDGLNNSRLQRSLGVLYDSLQYACDHQLPWLFPGDLVHTAGYTLNTVMTGVMGALAQFDDVEKVVVWGNHDARGVGGVLSYDQTIFPSIAKAVRNLIVLDSRDPLCVRGVTLKNGLRVTGAGYQPHTALVTYAEESDIGLYHQTVLGSLAPNGFRLEEGILASELVTRHQLAIVGHVHHPQQIDAPDGHGILIPGSPEHHNFGDVGEHGWWVVALKPGNVAVEFMPGGSPEFRTVETPDLVKRDGHFYRVRHVPVGVVLPDGVLAVAPSPTTVEHRDVLRGVADAEQVLQVWTKEQPPEGPVGDYLAVGRALLAEQDPRRLRDIRLSELQLTNFCCYPNAVVASKRGVCMITGRGRDYPSNGAGKSTLVGEALYWLLFGRTTKGLSADEVILRGTNWCRVEARFEGDGTLLAVRRTRGQDGHTLEVLDSTGNMAGSLTPWEAPSVNAMTEKLCAHLGITPEIFQNLAYFSQEKLLLFSSATDGERKTVLADLMGLRAYQEASTRAGAAVVAGETEIEKLDAKLEFATQEHTAAVAALQRVQDDRDRWQEAHDLQLAEAKAVVDRLVGEARHHERVLKGHQSRIEELAVALERQHAERVMRGHPARVEARLTELRQAQAATIERHAALVAQTEAVVRQACGSVADARTHAGKLDVAMLIQQERLDAVRDLQAESARRNLAKTEADAVCRSHQLNWQQAKVQLEQAQVRIARGVCPTCQQTVSAEHRNRCIEPLAQAVAEREAEFLRAEEEALRVGRDLTAALEAERKATTGLGEVRARIEYLQRARELVAAYDQAVHSWETAQAAPEMLDMAERLAAQLDQQDLRQHRDRLGARMRKVYHAIETKVTAWTHTVERAEATLEQLLATKNPHHPAQAQARVDGLAGQCQSFLAEQAKRRLTMAMYRYWQHGFSKQGIQSLLVEEIAARFNAERGTIFPLLTQGVYDVQFSTLSRTRAGDVREKTEFYVYEHGVEVQYEALSGGQRRRVDIGIMLVMAMAVSKWMGVRGVLGLLILDEVFGFLDASGAEGLLAALGQVTDQIPTVYVITHDTNLQALVPNVLCVEQDRDGTSRLV